MGSAEGRIPSYRESDGPPLISSMGMRVAFTHLLRDNLFTLPGRVGKKSDDRKGFLADCYNQCSQGVRRNTWLALIAVTSGYFQTRLEQTRRVAETLTLPSPCSHDTHISGGIDCAPTDAETREIAKGGAAMLRLRALVLMLVLGSLVFFGSAVAYAAHDDIAVGVGAGGGMLR